MRIFTIILTLCFSLALKADLPGTAYQYDRYSENGKYYFKSIPFNNHADTKFGKTIVYDSANRELYKIDNYLPTQSFISNQGSSLAAVTYWMWGHAKFEQQILVDILINQKERVQYSFDDLISDESKLKHTSSHTLWYSKILVTNDTLFILTLDENLIRIELATGRIVDKSPYSACNNCEFINNIHRPKTIYYTDIKYPEWNIFPDLVEGRGFRESFIQWSNKIEIPEYKKTASCITLYFSIDKLGNSEIEFLEAKIQGKKNEVWEKEISDWIISQNYSTDLLPINCDKWIFQGYFYLE